MTIGQTFRQALLCGVAALFVTACDPTRDAVEPSAGDAAFTIDYEKFTLDNGLDVILQVDRSDPIVAVTTVIHAGSNREKPGRTGFAHFFEHMAFNDSENVPRGWNRGQIPKWGGQRNGGTWSDGTIYYEVVPKDAFDKILWIDSDRLGYMINTVTTAALEREKQVVKNEKRQRVDNRAYGYTDEVIRKALYPEGHPYSWTVIGSLPDLQAATLDDVRQFHSEWYGPNNVTLSIVGDIDIEDTKKKVERWFGEIPRGREVAPPKPQPVKLTESKRLWFEDNFAKLPELRMTFPTVEAGHKDEQALDMLASILGGSKTSPLYTAIVDDAKLAPNVSAFHSANQMAGTFTIRVRANPGVDLDDVEGYIRTAMKMIQLGGVTDTELQRIRAEMETGLYNNLSTVLGKSRDLAVSNEFTGDPAYTAEVARKVRAVTPDDVMRVYRTYLRDKPFILTSFVPKGQERLAAEGSERATVWIEEVRADVASESVSAGAVATYEKTQTVNDRSEPPFGDLPLLKMPEVWERDLANGATLRGMTSDEVPLVRFDMTLSGGRWLDAAAKSGRLDLLADLMGEGTANRTSAELEQAIGLLGSGISVSANSEDVTITATSLSRNFEATVALIKEMLTEPRFVEDDFERVKSAEATAIKGREADPNMIAAQAYNKLLYGGDHPLGRPFGANADTLPNLTMDDLRSAHADVLQSRANFHLVGDVSPDRAAKALASLADVVSPRDRDRPDFNILSETRDARVFFIDVPGSKQSVLRIGKLAAATGDEDFNRIRFTNEKLGGGIAGDLAQVLRIEKGYTYGAYSSIPNGTVTRPFTIGTSVRANATRASLETIREMLINYGPGFDDAAREVTQQKIIKDNTRAFESLGAKLGVLRSMTRYDRPADFVEQEQAELLDMSVADFRDTAARYLDEDDMIYVIVGDKATQLAPVQAFAREAGKGDVVELDLSGDPV